MGNLYHKGKTSHRELLSQELQQLQHQPSSMSARGWSTDLSTAAFTIDTLCAPVHVERSEGRWGSPWSYAMWAQGHTRLLTVGGRHLYPLSPLQIATLIAETGSPNGLEFVKQARTAGQCISAITVSTSSQLWAFTSTPRILCGLWGLNAGP